jgi:hypothetical protein
MHLSNPIVLSLALVAGAVSAAAQAGPEVNVVFKNNSSATAIYRSIGANGISTYANASPKPDNEVEAGGSNNYRVQSNISPDANYASVRYQIGAKTCQFTTSYVKSRVRGVTLPKWNKSAVAGGGAHCGVTVTSVNPASHAWVVEFTMR